MAVPQRRTRAPHVRRAAGYAAAARVFAVPELLENILDYLPMKDLFFAQETCKHWKRVIAASTLLKRTLYLAPTQPTSFWSMKKVRVSGPDHDGDYPWARLTKNVPGYEPDPGHDGKIYVGAKFNPLFLTSSNKFVDLQDVWQCWCPTCITRRLRDPNIAFTLCDPRIGSLKSARNMLLTQPPCYQLDLVVEDQNSEQWSAKQSLVICNTGGIKVGDLLSGTRRLVRKKDSTLNLVFDDMFFPTMEEEIAGVVWND